MGDKGRQDLGKVDTPSNTGTHLEENGRQGETRPRESEHTIQHRHTCGETIEDKGRQDLGKAETPSNKRKQEGRQETRPREGGHTIQQRKQEGV